MKAKVLKFVAAGMVLSMLAGCIVLSVYPFYNAKDAVWDAALTGTWTKDGTTNELWQFSAGADKSYMLSTADANDTNCFEAHLFRLKEYQFLDLLTTNRSEFELPLHLISKVVRTNDDLTLQFMDYGWLANLLETNPAILRHIVVPNKSDDTNSGQMVYLTAATRDLQIFLLKYVTNTNAFSSDSTVRLKRATQ